jgi:beta-lactamase regulating signal transducer with metallopeptidase domain/type II secretory pathway component GspD/PulD (secretin)
VALENTPRALTEADGEIPSAIPTAPDVAAQAIPLAEWEPADVQFLAVEEPASRSHRVLWPAVLVAGWLIGFAIFSLGTTLRLLWLFQQLRQAGRLQRPHLNELVVRLCRRLKVHRPPRIWVTPTNRGPAVLGLARPTLLLPAALVDQRSIADLEPILAHELIHVRRRDFWLGWWQTAVQCVWWFHPLVWWANRSLSRLVERCCDDEVLTALDCEPARYARSLLSTLELKQRLKPVPTAPGVRPVDLTRERMERIMRTGQGRPAQTPWWGWGLLAIGLILTLPGAADRLAADGPRGLPAPEAGPVYSSPQAAEAAAKGSPVFDQQPVWQTYDVADVLSSDFADVPNDEERRRAFLNEVVAMAVRKSQRQFGLSLVDSQPVFRQITWDENQLRLEATPSEHAALAHLLKQRREHPGAVKQVVRIETRWMTDVAGELLKGVTWSESPDSSASSRRCAFLNDTQLQDLLKTIQSDPKSNLLSAPKVTTFSGQPAMIQVGSERQVLFPTNSGSEGDDRKPAVQVVTEGMTWELTPTVHTDGIISLRLALQQQAVTDVNMLQDGDARFQFPIVSASQVKTMLRLEPGRHVVLEFPDFRGKTVLGIVSATVEKPDRERKTSAIPQPNPIVPTYEPPANADDAIIVQLPVSRALDDTTPVRVRLSGKRSTIASDYLKRRASPPTTFGDVTKRLPDELRDHYHKLGYLFAAIDVNIEPDDESETGTGWKAIVYVNEGPRVLSETRKEVEPGNPFGGVTGEFDVELHPLLRHDHLGKAIHHHLQREGYFDARVTITRTKRPDSEPNAVPYRVRIETGRRFKVTCLQIAPGVSAMLDEGFPKDFPIQEGMAFDRQQVERAYPALRRWFAKHGHHNVDFTTHVRGGKTDGNVVIQFFAASISLDKLTRELVLNQRPADPRPVSQVESPWAPAEQASSPLLQNKERTWREIAQQRKASQGATNLNQTIQLEFHDTPLSDAIAEIQRRTNTNIVLDEVGLEELGIRRDMPVNLKLSGISGRSALKILAQSVGLAVAAGDEAVIITSPDRADPLIVMTYPVADLSHDPTKPRPSSTEAGKAAENNQENLADLIRSTIDPNSWDTSGGRGTMKFFAPNYLVIRQTQRNHEEIASLLSQLRRQRDLQIVFQAYERTVSNDDWASSEPLDGSESVRLLKAPSSNSGIKVTVLNSSRFSPVLITQGDVAPAANLKQGPIEVLPVVSADRRKIALLILPTSHPSRLEPLPITVPDGQTVLIDISATVPPGDPRLAEGSRAVLELTPKIIVPEEEEEVLRWPGSPPLLAPGSEVTR